MRPSSRRPVDARVALVVAVTVVAEVGDFRRFANPGSYGLSRPGAERALVRELGSTWRLSPSRQRLARRVLIEGAWTYRMSARVSRKFTTPRGAACGGARHRLESAAPLCARYRRMARPASRKSWSRRIAASGWLHMGDCPLAQPALV